VCIERDRADTGQTAEAGRSNEFILINPLAAKDSGQTRTQRRRKMATWQDRATRGLTLFEASSSDEGDRTWQIFNHILDEANLDDYISRDFYNVQQTAGGLPEGVSFEQFLAMISGHVRDELEGSSFDDSVSDDDFRAAALSFDDNIRRHMKFLNSVVHQAAAGEVHLKLWDKILRKRDQAMSIYSCYRDYLVDA
jgi:hypothetical protein